MTVHPIFGVAMHISKKSEKNEYILIFSYIYENIGYIHFTGESVMGKKKSVITIR